MAFLYSGYSPFGAEEMNFHLHHPSKGLISNNQNYNSKQGNSDESVSSMIRSEDQKWNLAAARLALSDNSRVIYESKAHNSVNGGGRATTPSLNTSSDNNNSKSSKNMSLNKPNSGTGKNKHKANTNPNSVQNEIVDSMINKILSIDIKQHNHHHHQQQQQQQQGFVHDPHALSSQKGILSHATMGSNMSVNMINSQNTQQGNPNAQRGNSNSPNTNSSPSPVQDKRFKTLPASEILPRNETLGGYIFVCNNDTMQEDLKRQLFGLPQRFRDSVRAIQPGLPLFLYNYTTHQLHGIFEAASFGGSNIDPTAWEDKKNKGESRFPAQVRIRVRRMCKPLEEDAFRPVLFHYDGPKFRLQLSVPETLAIMDLLSQNGPL